MDMTRDAINARKQALDELLEEKLVSDQDKARSSYLAGQIEDLYADYDQDRDGDQDCARYFDTIGDMKEWIPEQERTFRNWSKSAPQWLKDKMHRMTWWWQVEWEKALDSDGPPGVKDLKPKQIEKIVREHLDADGRKRAPAIYQTEVFGSLVQGAEVHKDDDDKVVFSQEAKHLFMLDIDHRVVLIPSSTDDHFHLFIDRVMDWSAWVEVLRALAKAGIISENYAEISIAREETMLRAPWVRKGHEQQDRQAALESWINGAYTPPPNQSWGNPPW